MKFIIDLKENNWIKFVVRKLKPKKYFLDTLPSPMRYKVAYDFGFDYVHHLGPDTKEHEEKQQRLIEEFKDSFIVFPIFDKYNVARIMNEICSLSDGDESPKEAQDSFFFGIEEFDKLLKNLMPVGYCIVKSKKEALMLRDKLNQAFFKTKP